ncbi:Testis-specific gene A2 protein, putative [Pediculus humanus corporis]|uniref:Testis-specific gene A2 protein, putative n=1 Tax=Pediculus humanus subsp. corporis TaxID=121224 RepID=E0W3C4_PEDHC|nr:Testis-specific gene A2 protein, putative [Pediculus humanus corporis]EEB20130.1 Testis-specific gene A2 protein, putative [Pediculus humanus corporis]
MSEFETMGEGGEEADYIGEYYGDRNSKNERHGFGQAILPNKDRYKGYYRKNLRHGKGFYAFRNGARYEGQYRKGIKHGFGTFWYPDGSKYEGDWKRDLRHGFGAYYYSNGDLYEGHWYKGIKEGLGTYSWSNNTEVKFLGTWRNGMMDGPGQIIHQGHRYHGNFKFNLPHGRGCYTFEGIGMLHGFYTHVKDPNYREEENVLPSGDNEENLKKPSRKGIIPLWKARKFTEFLSSMMPKDPVPVEIPDSVSTSPDEDSDSLPQPETEDEEGLESEVGPYMESLENLVRFSNFY